MSADYTEMNDFVNNAIEKHKVSAKVILENLTKRVESDDFCFRDMVMNLSAAESSIAYLQNVKRYIDDEHSPLKVLTNGITASSKNFVEGQNIYQFDLTVMVSQLILEDSPVAEKFAHKNQ